ncbi:hydroxyethylthiazole kinase [Microbacterium sp. TNHR37B]|uniref:hydroxyethylthiazole kinase n=1 Tax=Microbacterium sp. TNHR37B TaxID=1775956 RepID=UPI0007B1C54C|nr:hydroxyethylthiazole kinase [Microbacterium sp. TNHR37B]KZE90619.1 Hydroxyethylthiazole kinase [Microbacterium sp. TNHR37B]
MTRTPPPLIDSTCAAWEEVRSRSPLVHCITNSVVIGMTANAVLALGGAPAMVDIPGEAGPFAAAASGLLVNLGTPTTEQRQATREAVAAAKGAGTPWVLDPVAVGSLPVRTPLAHDLASQSPAIVRGNASEIIALAGGGAGGRGVDATDDVEAAASFAVALAARTGGAVAVSGPVDLIIADGRSARVRNGHALLTRMTGGGCALGAVMAAFAAVESDAFVAATAASVVYGVAADVAAEGAAGPGSFAVAFLDALAGLTADAILARGVVA